MCADFRKEEIECYKTKYLLMCMINCYLKHKTPMSKSTLKMNYSPLIYSLLVATTLHNSLPIN